MTSDESKLEILKKVEDGTLSVEEGADLIGILENADKSSKQTNYAEPLPPVENPSTVEPMRTSGCWKAAWSMILAGGAVLTAFSVYWIYLGFQNNHYGWGFWLSWIPLILGVIFMIFGWILMESPWLHVRIRSKGGGRSANFTIVMPLPLSLASWVMRNFGQYMPDEVKEKGIEEMIDEIDQSLKRGEPFQVEVDDKEDGDQVYVHITRS